MDPSNRTVALGDGGWQIGDSNGLLPYNPLYVDGVLEELDSAMEWHVDPIERVIRFHPNQSAVQGGGPAPPPVLTVATALDTVVRIQGTHADPPPEAPRGDTYVPRITTQTHTVAPPAPNHALHVARL